MALQLRVVAVPGDVARSAFAEGGALSVAEIAAAVRDVGPGRLHVAGRQRLVDADRLATAGGLDGVDQSVDRLGAVVAEVVDAVRLFLGRRRGAAERRQHAG